MRPLLSRILKGDGEGKGPGRNEPEAGFHRFPNGGISRTGSHLTVRKKGERRPSDAAKAVSPTVPGSGQWATSHLFVCLEEEVADMASFMLSH